MVRPGSGDSGGDSGVGKGSQENLAGLHPEHVSLIRSDAGNSGVTLDRHTDVIHAANESLDGKNPYSHLSADAATLALQANEAAIKATMDRIASLSMTAQKHQGRGQADDLLGQVAFDNLKTT